MHVFIYKILLHIGTIALISYILFSVEMTTTTWQTVNCQHFQKKKKKKKPSSDTELVTEEICA